MKALLQTKDLWCNVVFRSRRHGDFGCPDFNKEKRERDPEVMEIARNSSLQYERCLQITRDKDWCKHYLSSFTTSSKTSGSWPVLTSNHEKLFVTEPQKGLSQARR